MDKRNAGWSNARWILVGLVLAGSLWLFLSTVRHVPIPYNLPFEVWYDATDGEAGALLVVPQFERWYGNWRSVLLWTSIVTLFLLSFSRPRRRTEWQNAGVYTAFVVSLFTEMFGLPLTIYLLAPFLGLSPRAFGLHESHLWAFALDRLGVLPLHLGVYLVMVVSMALIAISVSLVAVGWATVYRGWGTLVIEGIYRYLRHPQYLGLILIVLALNIQWPTFPTLLMAPVLIGMYVRLATGEDEELATVFGPTFSAYAARTPGFIPWRSGGAVGGIRQDPAMPSDEGGVRGAETGLSTSKS